MNLARALGGGGLRAAVAALALSASAAPAPALAGAAAGAPAAPPAAAVAVELEYELRAPTAPVRLGEWTEIVVQGPLPPDVELLPPEGGAPDVLFGPSRSEARGAHRLLHLPLVAAREGALELEGLRLSGDGVSEALPAVTLEVAYPRPPGHTPVVAEPLDPLALPLPRALTWPFLAAALAGLAALGALVVWLGREHVEHVPVKPAHVRASEALARLRARAPDDPEAARAMVAEISAVLRAYIEERFALHAPARTTEEFLLEAAARRDALGARRERLAEFLQACDLATYAGVRPGRAELLELLDTAERFVEETRHEEPATAAAGLPGAVAHEPGRPAAAAAEERAP